MEPESPSRHSSRIAELKLSHVTQKETVLTEVRVGVIDSLILDNGLKCQSFHILSTAPGKPLCAYVSKWFNFVPDPHCPWGLNLCQHKLGGKRAHCARSDQVCGPAGLAIASLRAEKLAYGLCSL